LGTLSDDILSDIFSMLDMQSIEKVLKTCKHFKSIICGSNIKPHIIVNYLGSRDTNLLYMKQVRDLMYPLEYRFQNLRLPFSLEFKQVDPKRGIMSSPGYSVNILLWVEQELVTDEALQSLRWFISEISEDPQTSSILLLKGDSVFFKDEELLQKVRELSSLKILGVIDGTLECWLKFQMFNELELVYFATKEESRIDKKKFISIASKMGCIISTQETTFIMNIPNIRIISCNHNIV
jgi:hypothetical protein